MSYTEGMAQPVGPFRSKLEKEWADWFRVHGIEAEYVDRPWFDFLVGPERVQVEIKPFDRSMDFLLAAAERIPTGASLVVLLGRPTFCRFAWICTGQAKGGPTGRRVLFDLLVDEWRG